MNNSFNLRHSICIVEQIDDRRGGEYHGTIEVAMWQASNYMLQPPFKSFLEYLKFNYPNYDWRYDDGDDWNEDPTTDYCQYVVYLDEKKEHCLLAMYRYEREG